jgi:hypothetical protein
VPTDGLDVPPQRVDLSTFKVAVLEAGDTVLADVERVRELDLSETKRLSKLSQLVSADLLEHPAFVIVDSRSIYRARR